ncbi:MAG TPA: hypothetical protein VMO26_27205 [Vicinamibacterales bacterium]|nr:hypothetical protein [Vicinamibacterales bacterium]
MYQKLLVLTFIVLTTMGTRCMPSTPSALQQTPESHSGIRGTTRSVVISGVPGGPTTGGLASLEFAIAPIKADKPDYDKAIVVKSDAQGAFEVKLQPGSYWIGAKAKALDPANYVPGPVVFSETVVTVKAGAFIRVELVETGYAP